MAVRQGALEDLVIFDDSDAEYLWIADTIERFVAGTSGKWDWDDLISLPSKDPYLRSTRTNAI